MCALIVLILGAPWAVSALVSSHSDSSSSWRPLPHVGRREAIVGGAGVLTATSSGVFGNSKNMHRIAFAATSSRNDERSVASVDSSIVIPLWPTWGGGRVVPVSLGGPQQDPFLLLAHHKHWFDPRDPLRKPFQVRARFAFSLMLFQFASCRLTTLPLIIYIDGRKGPGSTVC